MEFISHIKSFDKRNVKEKENLNSLPKPWFSYTNKKLNARMDRLVRINNASRHK
jgi:hypothetical protein